MALNICKLHVFLVVFIFALPVKGQYSPVYNFYFDNEFIINPAFTGNNYYPVISGGVRKQWAGIDHSPTTAFIGANFRLGSHNFYNPRMMLNRSRFKSKERMGFGGFMLHDQNGPLQSTLLILSHAYFIPVGYGELSFGLSGKMLYYHINKSILDPLDNSDTYLLEMNNRVMTVDADFGMYYGMDQFWAGISFGDLFQSNNRLGQNAPFENKWDYFLSAGYKFFLKYLEMEPSAVVYLVDEKEARYDLRAKLYYKNFNWIEIGYRSTNSLLFSVAFKYRLMTIGYRYEQNLNKLANHYTNANEIIIGVNFGLNKVEGIRKVVK